MGYQEILKLLPEEPSFDATSLADEALNCGELGEPLCTYYRESVPEDPSYQTSEKYRWGAVCYCPHCGELFVGGWIEGGGVRLYSDYDDRTFDGYCPKTADPMESKAFRDEDRIICPHCQECSRLIRKSELKNHKELCQLQITEIKEIYGYTAVISWLARCEYSADIPYGLFRVKAREAIVVDRSGKLLRFSKVKYDMCGREHFSNEWRYIKSWRDPMLNYYYTDGVVESESPQFIYDSTDDLSGQTAEKTGLYQYLQSGGEFPNQYLRLQRKYPKIEALIKSDAANIIISRIDDNVDKSIGHGVEYAINLYDDEIFDFHQKKPNRILGIAKNEMPLTKYLTYEDFRLFKQIGKLGKYRLADYKKYQGLLSLTGLKAIVRSSDITDHIPNFEKIYNYFLKQIDILKLKDWEINNLVNTYCDYLEMIFQIYGSVNAELAYPKRLKSAHDDMVKKFRYINKGESGTFAKIRKTYKALEWNDKHLCIRLPQNGQELIKEGETLRHCVGSYIKAHESGEKTVFFVRHYRRPERSYYTLDISLVNHTVLAVSRISR